MDIGPGNIRPIIDVLVQWWYSWTLFGYTLFTWAKILVAMAFIGGLFWEWVERSERMA